ncbi:hypothetical protein FJZ55_03590 [Candidatus Woesearchaeota archaeon]|nr:hypothetical protein [Candidatus Woesearchaeota archaeon]
MVEFKVYLRSIVAKHSAGTTIDEIHKELFETFESDVRFPIHKDLEEVLKEVAFKSRKSGLWIASAENQIAMNFDALLSSKLLKIKNEQHTHSEVIFRLVQIGNYLGLKSWIGKREQSADSYGGMKFSDVSLQSLPFTGLTQH